MKPFLARGEIQLIGATTREEYRKYIEKDAAFERRFQPVAVEEPTKEEAVAILNGLKEKYEQHHHVHYTAGAIQAAVELSERYISDRFLPDKQNRNRLRNCMPAEPDGFWKDQSDRYRRPFPEHISVPGCHRK